VGDLLLYRKIEPDGYFVSEQEGALVGMVGTTICPVLACGVDGSSVNLSNPGYQAAPKDHLLA
jgi:hypothetical protein